MSLEESPISVPDSTVVASPSVGAPTSPPTGPVAEKAPSVSTSVSAETLKILREAPVGTHYLSGIWKLSTEGSYGMFYSEKMNCLVRPEGLGVSLGPLDGASRPHKASLGVAVGGIRKVYGTQPVMGCDPEFFIRKGSDVVPAFDYLPDKEATSDGLFWDGFQAETTVDLRRDCTCGACQETRISCHQLLAQRIGRQIQKLASKGLNIAPKAVWRIPPDMLKYAAEAHVALGCDPSRNAYGLMSRRVECPRELKWRFAGGHVHFELSKEERDNRALITRLVRTLDIGVGLPCVALAQNYDHFIRRRYYGLAGEYRLPPHGLEWRTLSNFWVMHPRAFMLTFDLARHILNLARSGLEGVLVGRWEDVASVINYSDVRSAKDFMRLNRDFYEGWCQSMYGTSKAFWAAIDGGVDKVISLWGQDVAKDWLLSDDYRKVPAWADL